MYTYTHIESEGVERNRQTPKKKRSQALFKRENDVTSYESKNNFELEKDSMSHRRHTQKIFKKSGEKTV